LSAKIPHKTEVGGVMLNIQDKSELAAAMRTIEDNVKRLRPDEEVSEFLVQPMVKGRGEALVGFRRDPQVGPLVTLAAGGVQAELYKVVAVRMDTVSLQEAERMVGEVTGLIGLSGYRNMPKGDLKALARVVEAISKLAYLERVAEAEINPVMIQEEG